MAIRKGPLGTGVGVFVCALAAAVVLCVMYFFVASLGRLLRLMLG